MIALSARAVLAAESVAAFTEAALPIIPATRAEAGCMLYAIARDIENPNTFWFSEEWDSEEALQCHLQSPHITKFLAIVATLQLLSLDVRKYQVSSVGGL